MMGSSADDDDGATRSSSRRPVYQQHRPGQQMTLDVPEDYSLRAYMEVLYLRPTVVRRCKLENSSDPVSVERRLVSKKVKMSN